MTKHLSPSLGSNATASDEQRFEFDYEDVHVDISVGEDETGLDVTPDVLKGEQFEGQDAQTMIDTHVLTCKQTGQCADLDMGLPWPPTTEDA